MKPSSLLPTRKVCSTFQRQKATRIRVCSLASAGALDRKYFSSPVATFLAQISQYVLLLHCLSCICQTCAAFTSQTCVPTVCRDSVTLQHGWFRKAGLCSTTSAARRPFTLSLGLLPEPLTARQDRLLGTSPTNICIRSSRSQMNSGDLPYPSSKVSQSSCTLLALARSNSSTAIFDLGRYVMSSGMPAALQRSRSFAQSSGRNNSA